MENLFVKLSCLGGAVINFCEEQTHIVLPARWNSTELRERRVHRAEGDFSGAGGAKIISCPAGRGYYILTVHFKRNLYEHGLTDVVIRGLAGVCCMQIRPFQPPHVKLILFHVGERALDVDGVDEMIAPPPSYQRRWFACENTFHPVGLLIK